MTADNRPPNYYSREYRPKSSITADDERMRVRIAEYLDSYFANKEHEVGKYITQELGIDLRSSGYNGYYVDWHDKVHELDIGDFLDIITACCKFLPSRTEYKGRTQVKHNLIRFVEKVFREQKVAYRMDEIGGIHPFVDANLTKQIEYTLDDLSRAYQNATLYHFEVAERSLLASKQDTRQCVRESFEAVENLFKNIYPKCTQLSNRSITNFFEPDALKLVTNDHEREPTRKLINGFVRWTETAHFYRHAAGEPEPSPPSESFAILFFSQALGFARWVLRVAKP